MYALGLYRLLGLEKKESYSSSRGRNDAKSYHGVVTVNLPD
jgi:hypothetical protein